LPFLKNLSAELEHIKTEKFQTSDCTTINIYAMDESRFGLLSIRRRCLTARGVKPLVPYQHQFKNFYLFGGYSPINGDHYTLELPYCNADCFQEYLNGLSGHKPAEFKIMILDNGAFHKARRLEIPPNIALLFLPPYSPELNPAEKIWRYIKDRLANLIFKTLPDLSDAVMKIIQNLSTQIIHSITG
jgi:hypothetical protein